MGIRKTTSGTARLKDIAGLYFSSLDAGLSRRDYLRFMRAYRGSLHTALERDRPFWQKVEQRARRLYYKFHGLRPVTPFETVQAQKLKVKT
jgi:heptose I phosphotransferase